MLFLCLQKHYVLTKYYFLMQHYLLFMCRQVTLNKESSDNDLAELLYIISDTSSVDFIG